MAKYTSDGNLIQGAATAYKNYDNAPGMYAGLDKAIKAGTDTMNTAVKDYEAEKQKKRDQDNAWYKAAGDTYNAAGSFMKADGPELTDTIALLDALQPEYTKAMESGTAAEKAAVVGRYNDIKAGVETHKQLRADISDDLIGASEANFNAGTLVGDDGRFGDFLTGLIKEDYKITYETNKEGVKQKMYTVGDASYTLEQINKRTVRKDIIPAQNFYKALDSLGANGVQYNDGKVRRAVDSIIPSGFNETREFMRGKNFTGKNIGEVMSLPENRADIEATINRQLFDSGSGEGSIKGDGIIQDGEFENFVSAATDPYHPMWNKGGKVDKQGWEKSSRAIATELLVNSISNEHVKNNPVETASALNQESVEAKKTVTPRANTLLGAGDGNLFNPAAENDDGGQGAIGYVGYKYGSKGGIKYDDDAVAAKIEKEEEFVDAFQNTYVPQEKRGRFFGYYVKDPVGKTQYLLRDPSDAKSGFKIITKVNAFKNAVGKAMVDNSKI